MELLDTLKSYLPFNHPPASEEELQDFENKYSIKIPLEFRTLLKQSNGVSTEWYFAHPVVEANFLLSDFSSIRDMEYGIRNLEDWSKDSVMMQHQKYLLQIASTAEGCGLYIGCEASIEGKIFIDDNTGVVCEDLTEDGEWRVYQVADSFCDLLRMLE